MEKQIKEEIQITEINTLERFKKELLLYAINSINSILLSKQEIKILEFKQELE